MPQVNLSFTLPEEKEDFEITNKAMALYCAGVNYAEFLRGVLKYEESLSETERAAYERCRQLFLEEFEGLI